jgi:chromosome segregation ATPase
LTGTANHFQYQVGELVEEVNELREKLGLEPYDIQQFASNTTLRDSSSILKSISEKRGNMKKLQTQKQKDRALLQVLALEIERLEEERLQLKTENRKMARQLGHKAAELELNVEDLQSMEEYRQALKSRRNGFKDYDNNEVLQKHETVVGQQKDLEEKEAEVSKLQKDMVEYKTRYEDLFEENGELRRGMQQILEDVKEQDGKSDVLIHCPALEKLISILDARHLWGNYHPAMSLKAQIDKLEGANSGIIVEQL